MPKVHGTESLFLSRREADALFEQFWAAYPRKVGKDAARKAWDKRRPSEVLARQMLDALEQQKRTRQWTRDGGQYIPHPTTWLNQGRWQDEVAPTSAPATRVGFNGYLWPCPHANPRCANTRSCCFKQDQERAAREVRP